MTKSSLKLTQLHTALGVRSFYDSVCYCNRCGMCASCCPSYTLTQQEPFSARGRNQAIRLLLEGKLRINKNRKMLEKMVYTCSLCGRCLNACPGQIPTVEHMLQLRRSLHLSLLPLPLFYLLRLRQVFPTLFVYTLRVGGWFKQIGITHLLAYIPGFTWLKHIHELLPGSLPKPFRGPKEESPSLFYLPSLEAEFLMPRLAQETWQLAKQKYRVQVWNNTSSGLFEYVYGDLRRARLLVRNLIVRHSRLKKGKLPLLTDSIDVYNFLRQAPQLFEKNTLWQTKAETFAKQIRFVTDLLPKKSLSKTNFLSPIQLMPTALVLHSQSCLDEMSKTLHTLFKKNFVKCEYTDDSLAPMGYGFVKHNLATVYALKAVQAIAAHQTQTVFVLSGLAALELAFYLRTFYPTAHAYHLVELKG